MHRESPFCGDSGVIQRGDVLHCDVGITYLRLNTDTQEMGYVLRRGETDVPDGLMRALAAGNRWQDLLTAQFVTGRTGNEIFARTHAARDAGRDCGTARTRIRWASTAMRPARPSACGTTRARRR